MLLLLLITKTSVVQKLYDSFSEVSCVCMYVCLRACIQMWVKTLKPSKNNKTKSNDTGHTKCCRFPLLPKITSEQLPFSSPPHLPTLLNNLESVQNDVLSFPHQQWLPIFSQPCPKPRLSRWRNHAYQIPNPVAAHICLQLNSFTIVETLFPTTPTSDSTLLSHSVIE